ncbi:hypothetical protein Aph01nite_43220 [Acrocarpospora phusangensis]|uniref:Uncharacterized protein n=2 Tax=Acrocarpospora phusangensis TaxID=1070424 RepID=A0A919UPS1_9ACTN|nr:hypothetical protein Aph01nite_43220 [Acrocarpospora phusangensis]
MDMRFCPWEGQTLPADHDCIAGPAPSMALTLEEVEAAYGDFLEESSLLGEHGRTVVNAVPGLIARLRRAERELEGWRSTYPSTGGPQ